MAVTAVDTVAAAAEAPVAEQVAVAKAQLYYSRSCCWWAAAFMPRYVVSRNLKPVNAEFI